MRHDVRHIIIYIYIYETLPLASLEGGSLTLAPIRILRSLKIYGIWPRASKQASKQANIHTHVRNAVPLVWGSLRLAPITVAN